jgi:hypothetical protein
MAGIKIVDLPAVGRDLAATDLFEMSLAGGTGSRKITGQEIMNASKLSVNNTPVINGTSGRIFFQGSTNVLQQSGNLFWDNTNSRLGIGTSIPISPIHILSPIGQQSTITLRTLDNTTSGGYTGINCFDNLDNLAFSFAYGNSGSLLPNSAIIGTRTATGVMSFVTGPSATVRATLFSTGNFAINTTTDAGFRLDVNGTARVGTTLTVGSPAGHGLINICRPDNAVMTTISSPDVCIINNAQGSGVRLNTDNVTYLHVRGYASQFAANVTGALTAVSGLSTALLVNNVINASANNNTLVGLDINPTFTNGAFTGVTNLGLRMQSGVAVFGATNYTNMLYGAIPRLFVSGGTYLNGITQIGSSNININGNNISWEATGIANNLPEWRADATGIKFGNYSTLPLRIAIGASENARFFSTGNVAIGTTTDAGFRLDVNGTARVSSTTTIGTSAHPFSSNLLTLISDQGSNSMRIGGGGRLDITGGMNAATLQSTDFVQAVRFLVGNGLARLTATTTNWLSVTDTSQSSNGSGNVSANLATFGTAYATINASAQVEVASTTKGFLPPRMTQTQRNAIASPAIGLEIYQTDATEGKYIYKSSGWTYIG